MNKKNYGSEKHSGEPALLFVDEDDTELINQFGSSFMANPNAMRVASDREGRTNETTENTYSNDVVTGSAKGSNAREKAE